MRRDWVLISAAACLLGVSVVAALSPGVLIALGSLFTGVEASQNVMAFTMIFYTIAIGYAVLRHDLLEVDRFVRRSLSYAFLAAIATLPCLGVAQGLGLSISYGIVSRHGGTIRVRSAVGQGTCFRVELPMRASEAMGDDALGAISELRGAECDE